MKVGSLEIEMMANMARLSKDVNDARGVITGSMNSIERAASSALGSLKGLVAGVSFGAIVGQLISTQREFDVLNSSLVTVTGSSAAAKREMDWIKQFAATTPFALNEVTGAFIKMSSLGLDPSKEALTSYGNTASAMGKSLNQMIEAVADAATGEFERLKEFGIRAKKDGDEVKLTFRGVSETVKMEGDAITEYLRKIGDNNFAGAMAERAKTLDGAISNLTDTWSELFRVINEESTGSIIYDSVKLATGAIEDLIIIIKAMSSATQDANEDSGAMKTIQEGLAVVFETVAVLGVNLKYVLVQIGNEIGGLAAQAAALMRLDLAAASAIGDMMKSDAAAARKQVDETTARILGARKLAEDAKRVTGDSLRRSEIEARNAASNRRTAASGGGGTGGKGKKGRGAGGMDDETQALWEIHGMMPSFQKDWDILSSLFRKGKIDMDQLVKAQAELLAKQPAIREETRKREEEDKKLRQTLEEVADAYGKIQDAANDSTMRLREEATELRDQRDAWRMTGAELRELEAVKLEDVATSRERRAALLDDIDLSGRSGEAVRREAQAFRELAEEKRKSRTGMGQQMLEDTVGQRVGALDEFNAFNEVRGSLLPEDIDKLATEKLRRMGVDPEGVGVGLLTIRAQFQQHFAELDRMAEDKWISDQARDQAKAQLGVQLREFELQGTQEMLGTLASLQNSSNKKLAAIGKAAAIAQATMDGIVAVQKALTAAPPPWNYALAAAVGVAAAANVARIAGLKGFQQGGFTGDVGTGQVAGVVHGQEFVMNAAATRRNRAALERMNRGQAANDQPSANGGTVIQIPITNHITVSGSGSQSSAEQLTAAATTISKKTQADILDSIRMGGVWSRVIKQN